MVEYEEELGFEPELEIVELIHYLFKAGYLKAETEPNEKTLVGAFIEFCKKNGCEVTPEDAENEALRIYVEKYKFKFDFE